MAASNAYDKAKKAKVQVGKIPFDVVGPGKCSAFFGDAFKKAIKNKEAVAANLEAKSKAVDAFKEEYESAKKQGTRLHKECLCTAQTEFRKTKKALAKKDYHEMATQYRKSKMMICVLDGTNTGHASCAPPLPKLTFPKLPTAVTGAQC